MPFAATYYAIAAILAVPFLLILPLSGGRSVGTSHLRPAHDPAH
jgi:hypothetical protein